MPPNLLKHIENHEWFYRSVTDPVYGTNPAVPCFEIDDNGKLHFSKYIWNDTKRQPSVHRKQLLSSVKNALFDRNNPKEGLVKIQCLQVRSLTGNVGLVGSDGRFSCEVIFDPTKEKPAHSQIVSNPPFGKSTAEDRRWKKLQHLLAEEASKHGWALRPKSIKYNFKSIRLEWISKKWNMWQQAWKNFRRRFLNLSLAASPKIPNNNLAL